MRPDKNGNPCSSLSPGHPFLGEGSPTKIDVQSKTETLVVASLLVTGEGSPTKIDVQIKTDTLALASLLVTLFLGRVPLLK